MPIVVGNLVLFIQIANLGKGGIVYVLRSFHRLRILDFGISDDHGFFSGS